MSMEWLGYWLDYARFEIGITEKRSAWLIRWITEVLDGKSVLVRNLTEGLGRLGFASGVLEWHRPFLAPLYAWTAVVPQGAYIELPPMLRLVMMHLRNRMVEGARTVKCLPIEDHREEIFRTDAAASDKVATLGGWETKGGVSKANARWFSLTVTENELPHMFKGGDAKRTVAAWELLATVVAFSVFVEKGNS